MLSICFQTERINLMGTFQNNQKLFQMRNSSLSYDWSRFENVSRSTAVKQPNGY